MLQAFVAAAEVAACRTLDRVFCSGEALPFELQERFFERFPGVELHNLYGPTETAVEVKSSGLPAGRRVARRADRGDRSPRRGSTCSTSSCSRCPWACPASSTSVALRWWRQRRWPDLTRSDSFPIRSTAERAAGCTGPETWSAAPYGAIEFLGRTDHQVNIGNWVELEIEAVLGRRLRSKRRSWSRAQILGQDRLVAYVVPREKEAPSFGEVRSYLEPTLPASTILVGPRGDRCLSVNANGKLDRRASPAPAVDDSPAANGFTAPRNDIEKRLAAIWAETLCVKHVSIHDNFFELGGHSLMAVGLFARGSQLSLAAQCR